MIVVIRIQKLEVRDRRIVINILDGSWCRNVIAAVLLMFQAVAYGACADGSYQCECLTDESRGMGVDFGGSKLISISINSKGDAWGIGTGGDKGSSGNIIRRRLASQPQWSTIGGYAFSIVALSDGKSVITNTEGTQQKYNGKGGWNLVFDGFIVFIDQGPDGNWWGIGNDNRSAGSSIFKRANNAWMKIPGEAVNISGTPDGAAWVVNNQNGAFELVGGSFVPRGGNAKKIDVGPDGTVWKITNIGEVSHWSGKQWIKYKFNDATPTQSKDLKVLDISVEQDGNVLALTSRCLVRFTKKNF